MDRFNIRIWIYNTQEMKHYNILEIPKHFNSDYMTEGQDYRIMQSTGIRDCNNKLIYESDVIAYPTLLSNPSIVRWANSDACFFSLPIKMNGPMEAHNFRLCQIIGNFYQHPNLSKEAK